MDWVGYVDWNVRDFHGYMTDRGSTYNAYLVRDEKTALIDTVKAPYAPALLAHVAALMDPACLDYIVCNHAEPDHAGSLPAMLRVCPRAEVVCDEKCRVTLSHYYDTAGWRFRVVKDGDRLTLGRRTLTFIETPMVHWPESMFTYVPEDRVLFSMDAFGQHYASSLRFDDDAHVDDVLQEAKTYYANILMLYHRPIAQAFARVQALAVELIAPSHGVVWRRHIPDILAAYQRWVAGRPEPKVLVLYDSMWDSTATMAHAILDGAAAAGARAQLLNIRANNLTVIAREMLEAATFAFGSPTLNMTLMPEAAAALTYLKGLRPVNKAGFAFGSHGWSAHGGPHEVDGYLRAMNMEILREPLLAQYAPSPAVLDACRAGGRLLAERALRAAKG